MSRTTEINVKVNSGQSVSTISKLKQAFEELNKAKNLLGEDGAIKLKVDLGGMDAKTLSSIASSIGRLTKQMNGLNEVTKLYSAEGKSINITNNQIIKTTKAVGDEVGKTGDKIVKTANNIAGTIITYEILSRVVGNLTTAYTQLTTTSFNVGTASQMSISQIEKLNTAFTEMSTTVPASANEIGKAIDALIRTGRTYEDSSKIIGEVAKLATASGESLADTAGVVTKVMVSLGVSGDRVEDTLNAMHSTAIQTSASMSYLADSFKNVAGTASVLAKSSGLAGRELDDYKQKILDVSLASIGTMANLGLSASEVTELL